MPRNAGWLAVPALAATWPLLFVAGNNPGEFSLADLVVAALLAALSGFACAAIAAAITRRVSAASLGGVVLVAAMYAPLLIRQLRHGRWLGTQAHGPIVPVLIALIVLLALVRLRAAGDRVQPALLPLTLAIATLFVLGAVQAASSIQRSSPSSSPVPIEEHVVTAGDSAPDIYLVVLDQYATSEVTKGLFQFDNREFEDSLRALGFRIPKATWSNYPFTAASIASMLDMRHVDGVADSAGSEHSLVPLNRIIAQNTAFRLARARGYRIVFVPSSDFEGTRSHPTVDRRMGPAGVGEWIGEHATSPLAIDVAKLSVIGSGLTAARVRLGSPWRVLAPFRRLRESVHEPGPKFVFGHTMMTHQPFLFTGTCKWARARRPEYVSSYREQIECTNRLVLEIVGLILANRRPSVILLQSDHGTSLLGGRSLDDPRTASAAQVAERLGAFSAYRLPDGSSLRDTVTPVNLLRLVFNRYLGTALPLQSDDAWYSVVSRTYDFVPVDPRALTDTARFSRREAGSGIWPRGHR
ncbi:MAG: hypothetical protein ACREOK_10885 [Gemmatimonadaceae bacterium]